MAISSEPSQKRIIFATSVTSEATGSRSALLEATTRLLHSAPQIEPLAPRMSRFLHQVTFSWPRSLSIDGEFEPVHSVNDFGIVCWPHRPVG